MGKSNKNKKEKSALGRSILKQRGVGRPGDDEDYDHLHTTDIDEKKERRVKMMSATERTALEEFFEVANLDGRAFEAEKQNIVVIEATSKQIQEKTDAQVEIQRRSNKNTLTIPRRPYWDYNTSPEQLEASEREAFLAWRRNLAELEEDENLVITPFEKNLEVWRQLWRVVERSDLVVQIVDARNPLLFRCPDLESFVLETAKNSGTIKKNVLLINKADLLSKKQRLAWSQYFKSQNLDYIFWSANFEEIIQQQKLENEGVVVERKSKTDITHPTHIFQREELLARLNELCPVPNEERRKVIGLVGYPNVGKSSTINVLVLEKKVAVAPTPGKTKHFQTILLGDELCLCDCPGLVFPTIMGTKADMIVNGLLPIDQIRDCIPPISLICKKIPKPVLEAMYGIVLPPPKEDEDPNRVPTAYELLGSYATVRGYMASHGNPDNSRAARYILKDFVSGRLLYCTPPPGVSDEEFTPKKIKGPIEEEDESMDKKKGKEVANIQKPTLKPPPKPSYSEDYDSYLKKQSGVVAFTKGRYGTSQVGIFTRPHSKYYSPIPISQLQKQMKKGVASQSASSSSSSS